MLNWQGVSPAKWLLQAIAGLMLLLPVNSIVMAAGVKAAPSIVPGSDWLRGQPLKHYTLQLLATRDSAGIRRFAAAQGFAGPLVHFVVDQQGREMHLLALGSYATRAEANRAAKALPDGIRPWIRTLASIQSVAMTSARPVEKTSPAVEIEEGGIKAMPWLWSQDPRAFTIQLAGAESRDTVEEVMRKLALPGERMVVVTQSESGPWHTLIYGRFADEASARATISRLPASLQQAGPWPRSFASLHDEISRATP